MAVFTHTLGITSHSDAGTIASTTDTYTGDSENDLEEVVAGSATNVEYDLVLTVANIVSMIIYSDHDLVIKTNSTAAPGNTVTLTAKKQVVWNTDSVMAKPFTVNTTKLFVSNAGTPAASLKIRVLEDIAP